jgi:hypothetical protein
MKKITNKRESIDKIPPHNLEAESNVLGSILIDDEAINKIADILNPEDFYREAHRKVFESCLELYEKREPIDILSVANSLEDRKELENIGELLEATKMPIFSNHLVEPLSFWLEDNHNRSISFSLENDLEFIIIEKMYLFVGMPFQAVS